MDIKPSINSEVAYRKKMTKKEQKKKIEGFLKLKLFEEIHAIVAKVINIS